MLCKTIAESILPESFLCKNILVYIFDWHGKSSTLKRYQHYTYKVHYELSSLEILYLRYTVFYCNTMRIIYKNNVVLPSAFILHLLFFDKIIKNENVKNLNKFLMWLKKKILAYNYCVLAVCAFKLNNRLRFCDFVILLIA